MTKYKALYQGMRDDLKDAEMMINYAHEIQEEGDKTLADDFAKYATYRLEHFDNFHKILLDELKASKDTDDDDDDKEEIEACLWKETDKALKEWHNKIKSEIEQY